MVMFFPFGFGGYQPLHAKNGNFWHWEEIFQNCFLALSGDLGSLGTRADLQDQLLYICFYCKSVVGGGQSPERAPGSAPVQDFVPGIGKERVGEGRSLWSEFR